MNHLVIASLLISFFVTLFAMGFWIRKAKQIGLLWENMNKIEHPREFVGSGGVVMVLGFIVGVLAYVAVNTFYFESSGHIAEIFTILASVMLVSGVALMDDLLGWKKGGLSVKSRICLILIAAIPLMVVNAGESSMIGIEFGLLYPLLLIPIGIVGATATYNFLAGMNGLEAGQGIIMLSALAFVTYKTGNAWLGVVALCMVASLIAFYIFNRFPAKVLPGDTLTYPVGAMIAIIAIFGNIEKIALFFFIPYIIETGLKLRGGLKKESFAEPKYDGSLELRYGKIYGLTHLSVYILGKFKKKVSEKDTVYAINAFQILVIIVGLILFL